MPINNRHQQVQAVAFAGVSSELQRLILSAQMVLSAATELQATQ